MAGIRIADFGLRIVNQISDGVLLIFFQFAIRNPQSG